MYEYMPVQALSNFNPSYQWQFNGTNILNATNATYAIASVVTSNAGNYSLIVTNLCWLAISDRTVRAAGPQHGWLAGPQGTEGYQTYVRAGRLSAGRTK